MVIIIEGVFRGYFCEVNNEEIKTKTNPTKRKQVMKKALYNSPASLEAHTVGLNPESEKGTNQSVLNNRENGLLRNKSSGYHLWFTSD